MDVLSVIKPMIDSDYRVDSDESGRPFSACQITPDNISDIITWGEGSISPVQISGIVLDANLEPLPIAVILVNTKLGPIYGFIGDWVYRTASGRYRLGNSESINHYERVQQ